MDFTLSETQLLLKETAERLVKDRYGFEQRKKIVAEPEGFSPQLWKEYADLGLLGIEIGEDFGGSGGSFQDLAVVLEAFGRGLVVEPYLSTVVLGASLIARAGSNAQKKDILPKVAEGKLKLALAYGEPRARYSLNHVETTAKRDSDGYIINGAKAVVLGGDSADTLIVAARSSGSATDTSGISLLLIDAKAKGVEVRSYPNMDDRHAAEIVFENVRAPANALLGTEGQGLPHLQAAVDRGAAAVVCEAVGTMTALNELTIGYLKTRNQFGRPIGAFQVLQHRMADMAMAEQQARSMAPLAALHANNDDAAMRAQAISAAKVQIGKSGQEVGRGAIQLHGGIGLTMEYVAGHYFRRLTAIEMMFGDTAYHLERFSRG